jgi:hypothetical protein
LRLIREEISRAVFAWNRWNFSRNFKRVSCKGNFEVRILRGQPASPGSRDFCFNVARKPAVRGLIALGEESLSTQFENSSARRAENLRAASALFPFSGEMSRRLGSIALRDRVASAK